MYFRINNTAKIPVTTGIFFTFPQQRLINT